MNSDSVLPLLARFLHVRRSELERTLQVSGFAIVVGWAMYTAFNATQAIFLAKAGPEAYPLFFIILALAVWPAVALQGWFTRKVGLGRAFRVNLALNAVVPLGIYVAYKIDESSTVSFAAYVIYSVAFELVMLHFWSFVSQHFNLLEGKRVFPVIAAGSSIGYILAGVTTTLVAIYATEPLMFVWAFGASASALMSRWLERRLYVPTFADDADEFFAEDQVVSEKQGLRAAIGSAMQYLSASRLVLSLVLLALVLQVASRVGDYLVAQVFVQATKHDLQALTILIGNAWLASYVVQLAVSLFITPWVLNKLGVKQAILVLPVFTLIGFTAVAINPVLATSLFLFIVRNGLQTGLDDPAESVLGGALPAQIGPKLKFLLDNIVLPGAAVLTGVSLFILRATIGAKPEVLAAIGIPIAIIFIAAALWERSLYVTAIYQRLRTHALTLSDFQRALGRPSQQQIEELQSFVREGDDKVRNFAAGALAQVAPDVFAAMVPELLSSEDPDLRRLTLETAPAGSIAGEQLAAATKDPNPWVGAAAAVAGSRLEPPWEQIPEILSRLESSDDPQARAAAVWAASYLGDTEQVVAGLRDPAGPVRLEAIRSFARMKGDVAGATEAIVACLRDEDIEVRREALRQASRWAPPQGEEASFAEALVDGLTSGDGDVRRLASEAMSVQAPTALEKTLPLLYARNETAASTVEALIRSGRPDLFERAKDHLLMLMTEGTAAAKASASAATRARGEGDEAAAYAFLRIALDDYVRHTIQSGLAAMRALHGKRGFATVERGLRSAEKHAQAEATETLLNFGPSWLCEPLAQLLDPESFELSPARPLSHTDMELLENHPDTWVKEAAKAVTQGPNQQMKELIALKRVPLFARLTLEQLSSIDRLMVTRRYVKGETLFTVGDPGSELFVVLEGQVRIHLDREGSEVTLARVGINQVIGEMAIFDDEGLRSASAEAIDDTTVRVLRRDKLNAIVYEHPEIFVEFLKYLSQRLRVMNEDRASAQARPEPISKAAEG